MAGIPKCWDSVTDLWFMADTGIWQTKRTKAAPDWMSILLVVDCNHITLTSLSSHNAADSEPRQTQWQRRPSNLRTHSLLCRRRCKNLMHDLRRELFSRTWNCNVLPKQKSKGTGFNAAINGVTTKQSERVPTVHNTPVFILNKKKGKSIITEGQVGDYNLDKQSVQSNQSQNIENIIQQLPNWRCETAMRVLGLCIWSEETGLH